MARIRRNEKNGPGLLFVLVTLIVVAVVGARFFGFYPDAPGEGVPPVPIPGEEQPGAPPTSTTPKVLVFHSHATENYRPKDSHEQSGEAGDVVAVGKVFVQALLENEVVAVHDQTIHDRPRYSDSFLNSSQMVERAITENPELQMVFDVHRDGLQDKPEGYTTVNVNGENVAQILFVIGDQNNDLVEENMAFAERISNALEAKYPGVSRGVRVFKSDYSTELHPNSIMVIIGDWKGNTIEEANIAVTMLAEVVSSLVE